MERPRERARTGPFDSEMTEGGERTAPGFKQLIADGTLMKRIATPAEIVGPVLYLASDAVVVRDR